MVFPIIQAAVKVKHLVESIKVAVIVTINAMESLSVVKKNALKIFQAAVKVRKLTLKEAGGGSQNDPPVRRMSFIPHMVMLWAAFS